MNLDVVTPVALAVHADGVVSLQAEDASGAFGVWSGHADLVTVLEVSVVSWRCADGSEGHCAVRGGVLTIRGGAEITVATPEAVPAENLAELRDTVLRRMRTAEDETRTARAHARRLHLAALDQLLRYSRDSERAVRSGHMGLERERRDDGR